MNYQRIYHQLIANAIARNGVDGYCEKHHIQPKSLGGTDDVSNIVALTAREHFIAHMLLAKMHGGTQWYAVLRLKGLQKQCVNSRLYTIARQKYAAHRKIELAKNNPMHNVEIAKQVASTKRQRGQYTNPWGKWNAMHTSRMQNTEYANSLKANRVFANQQSVIKRQIANAQNYSTIYGLFERHCSYKEIAQLLNMKYSTVYRILQVQYA
jgi:hypothetical protein